MVGAGHLGALHARKYAALEGVRLCYVVDVDGRRATEAAALCGAAPLADYRELAHKVDIASVAAPGVLHHEIAAFLMAAGIDVLLEKPMAATVEEARALAELARREARILQVGHLERFNPAIVRLKSLLDSPRFIEGHRLAPFRERGTDIDVVLDLMVHDLDVILALVGGAVATVDAVGVAVLTDQIDVANARLRLTNGLIANLNVSRVAPRRERKIRFFQPDAYISVDYEARRIRVYRREAPPPGSPYPLIAAEQIELEEGDPLADEVAAFVESARNRQAPPVTAEDGVRVIELSERIKQAIREQMQALSNPSA